MGKTPFNGSLQNLLHAVAQVEPTNPRELVPDLPWELVPDLPWELEAICLKALEKQREQRCQSALELSLDLERFLNGQPIEARRAT